MPAPERFEYVQGGPEDVPRDRQGIYFLDIDTGEIEGWNGPGSAGGFAVSDDNRFIAWGNVLIDRATQDMHSWSGGVEPVTSSGIYRGHSSFATGVFTTNGGQVLFRNSRAAGEDDFFVVDMDSGAATIASFRTPAPLYARAAFAQDGRHVAVAGSEIHLVDVDTGEVDTLAPRPLGEAVPQEGSAQALLDLSVRNTLDGEAFLVTVETEAGSAWAHFNWDGELFAQGTAPSPSLYPSPGGDLLAWAEPLVQGIEGWQPPYAPSAVVAVDTADGNPVFRVLGVDFFNSQFVLWGGNRWLADSSGIVVRAAGGEVVAMADGGIREPEDVVRWGLPSPHAPETFVVDGGVVVDADGDVLATFGFTLSGLPPWGLDANEARFALPVPATGFEAATWRGLIRPTVEHPPFDEEEPQVRLYEGAQGLVLFSEPGGGEVVGQLDSSLEVRIRAVHRLHREEWERKGTPQPQDAFRHWALVTASDGTEGWLWMSAPPDVRRVATGGSCLNVREEPSTDATIIDCYVDGVPLVDRRGGGVVDGWAEVWTPDGREGWASEEFLAH